MVHAESTGADEAERSPKHDFLGFDLIQRDIVVASVDCEDRDTAWREIMHYAMQYAQDGECLIQARFGDRSVDSESDDGSLKQITSSESNSDA